MTTEYEEHVLGGQRAMNDAADGHQGPQDAPAWHWTHLAVLGAVAFALGVIVYNLAK